MIHYFSFYVFSFFGSRFDQGARRALFYAFTPYPHHLIWAPVDRGSGLDPAQHQHALTAVSDHFWQRLSRLIRAGGAPKPSEASYRAAAPEQLPAQSPHNSKPPRSNPQSRPPGAAMRDQGSDGHCSAVRMRAEAILGAFERH